MDGHDCGAASEAHTARGGGGVTSLVAGASVEVRTTRGSLSPVASLVCGSPTVARTMRGSLSAVVSLMGGTSVVATDSLALVVSLVGATAIVTCVGLRGGTAVAGSEPGNKALPQSPAPVREADPRPSVAQPRFTLLSHRVTPEGGAPQQTEVVLVLSEPGVPSWPDGFEGAGEPSQPRGRQARSAPARRLSQEFLPESWRRQSLFSGLSPTRHPHHRRSHSGGGGSGSWSSVLSSSKGLSLRPFREGFTSARATGPLSSDEEEGVDRLASELSSSGRLGSGRRHRLAFSLRSSSSDSLSDQGTANDGMNFAPFAI
ncbi:mitogen-activated protein kinase kinase kinase 20 [Ixodes scapularis]